MTYMYSTEYIVATNNCIVQKRSDSSPGENCTDYVLFNRVPGLKFGVFCLELGDFSPNNYASSIPSAIQSCALKSMQPRSRRGLLGGTL
jgi:hypothetical protein